MSQLLMRRPHLNELPAMPNLGSEFLLRPATPGDETAIAAVLSVAFEDKNWTDIRVKKELTEAPDVIRTYVIIRDAQVVATASARLLPDVYPDAGYVHWVAALPGYSGKGLGFAVTLATLQKFQDQGCESAVLETDDARLPAIKTYLKLGFEPFYRDDDHAIRWATIKARLDQKR